LLVKIACKFVKDDEVPEEEVYPELLSLDKKLMISPTVALGEVNVVAVSMARIAKDNIARGLEQLKGYVEKRSEEIWAEEDKLDKITDATDHYLIELSANVETEMDMRHHNMLMQTIRDIERIGDYATNLDEMSKEMHASEVTFSDIARQELDILADATQEILRLTIEALETDNEYVTRRIEPLEEIIDRMVLLLKERHTARLCQGKCTINSGLVFMDALTYFERTADQCSNTAMRILGKKDGEIMKNYHAYLDALHASGDQSYRAEQENRRLQYLVPLETLE
jgi:phosphate:Na+ symporter